jgi:aarF domain-containing kinase
MSGKRVLDAVSLLKASRNVAAKHFEIRLSQADIYTKTSSFFKAAQRHAPPIIANTAQNFSQSVAQAVKYQTSEDHIPSHGAASGNISSESRDGIKQDHFYNRSQEHGAVDPVPSHDLDVRQKEAEREPLPDGTIPPKDSPIGVGDGGAETFSQRPIAEGAQHPTQSGGQRLNVAASSESTIPEPSIQKPLGPQAAMKAQRQFEDQIPGTTADPPPSDSSAPTVIADEDVSHEFSVEQEQDLFYQPPGTTSPVLSALPRMRVPKIENDVQGGDSHIPKGLNADVFYSGNKASETQPLEDEPTEEQLSQMFASPRIARMLGAKAKYVPKGTRSLHTTPVQTANSAEAEKEDIKELAADMAKDVQTGRVSIQLPSNSMV